MPNDAKLGLVAGVAAVVLIGAIFFRSDAQGEVPAPSKTWSPQLPPPHLPPPQLPPQQPSPADDSLPLPPPPMLPHSS
ncbi:MAG: hypothetical protein L0Y71_07505 [Gemmataceae bacterium]|nr:hypothetical protein [Gemmataceae bacterium]